MADLKPRAFTIRASIQLAAAEYDAEIEGVGTFLAASAADRVDLETGYLNAAGQKRGVGNLRSGIIGEYVLTVTENEISARVRGRDQAALALETQFNRRFIRAPEKDAVSTDASEDPSDPYFVPKVVGLFSASYIAGQAAAAAGLNIRWEAPDYELQGDFLASGRAIDTVYALVRPFQLCEPFRVDVSLQNDTLIVHERNPVMVADPLTNVFTVKEACANPIDLRRRRPVKFGKVRLRGAQAATSLTFVPAGGAGGGSWVGGEETKENTQDKASDQAFGGSPSRVIERVTYRMPDQIVLRVEKSVYAGRPLQQVSKETTVNTWEGSVYGPGGPTNKPKQRATESIWSGWIGSAQSRQFRELRKEVTTFGYDGGDFLKNTTKTTSRLDLKVSAMKETDLEVVTLRDDGPLWVKQTTETFRKNTKTLGWDPVASAVQTNAGHRPGGPGRSTGSAYKLADGLGGALAQVELTAVLSTDADAQDIDESFEMLDAAALAVIMDRLTRANGLWEYEALFTTTGMPWLFVGSVVEFTDLADDEDTAITIGPMLVHELTAEYSEASGSPSLTSRMKAVYWGA